MLPVVVAKAYRQPSMEPTYTKLSSALTAAVESILFPVVYFQLSVPVGLTA